MKKSVSVAIVAVMMMSVFAGVVSAGVGELHVTPTSWSPTIDAGDSKTKEFEVKNYAGVYEDYAALEGVTVSITSGPEWLEISQSQLPVDVMPSWHKTSTAYKFILKAAPSEDVDGSFSYKVRVSCTKGFPSYIDITGEILVPPPPVGELHVKPTSWSPTINAGDLKTKEFEVENRAGVYEDYAALEGVTVSITSGPGWLEIVQSELPVDVMYSWYETYKDYKFTLKAVPPEDVDGSFSYKVRVSCTKGFPSYIDITGKITVTPIVTAPTATPRPTSTPRPTLPPVETPTTGQIAIGSSPEGASLYIDGEYYGKTEYYNPKPIGLKAGTYTIKLTKDGYKDYTETITVEGGYIHKKTIILESLPVTPTETTATPTPTKPTQTPPPETTPTPGFEAIFAIAGLLAVAYLVRRRK